MLIMCFRQWNQRKWKVFLLFWVLQAVLFDRGEHFAAYCSVCLLDIFKSICCSPIYSCGPGNRLDATNVCLFFLIFFRFILPSDRHLALNYRSLKVQGNNWEHQCRLARISTMVFNYCPFFAFDLDVVSWQCISNWNFFWEMLFQFLLPFALSLFWIVLLFPTILYNGIKQRVNTLTKRTIKKQWIRAGAERDKGQLDKFFGKFWNQTKSVLGSLGFLDIFHNEINLDFLKAKVLVSFESTYVISTYYALASLSHRDIGGKAVVYMAPYYLPTTKCLILGIIGLIFLSIGFPIFLLVRCMTFEPTGDEDPGRFGARSVRERYGWLYSRFRIRKWKLAFCIFLHRFVQICSVVFIRSDPGMALNVTFVISLLFGLFVGLQHPNISLKLNAIEYLTMLSTVTTVLCGMWFTWINVARDLSTNTSRYDVLFLSLNILSHILRKGSLVSSDKDSLFLSLFSSGFCWMKSGIKHG